MAASSISDRQQIPALHALRIATGSDCLLMKEIREPGYDVGAKR
jgi:hypothetical protein